MTDVAWATLALVGITIVYVILIGRQAQKSDKNFKSIATYLKLGMLLQKRYQVESDVTQLRIKVAELKDKGTALEILGNRLKQCSDTITETAEEIGRLEKELKELEGKGSK